MIDPLTGQRQPGETRRAILACNGYLRLGPGRSLARLWQIYGESTVEIPPSRTLRTLEAWSVQYGWQDRAALYDAEVECQRGEYARLLLSAGLAAAHERVRVLKDLAEALAAEIFDEDGHLSKKVWLRDYKQIAGERVELIRFNHQIIEQFRETLDDIAKEVGGRKVQLEHAGADGGPIPIKTYIGVSPDEWDDEVASDRAERITKLLTRVRARQEQENEEEP